MKLVAPKSDRMLRYNGRKIGSREVVEVRPRDVQALRAAGWSDIPQDKKPQAKPALKSKVEK